MNRTFASALIASGLLLAASSAGAAARDPQAEIRSREAAARVAPSDGGAMIELASAYQRAGRTAEANTALRRALTLDNAMLETPTGDSVWSHTVAKRALTRDAALASR